MRDLILRRVNARVLLFLNSYFQSFERFLLADILFSKRYSQNIVTLRMKNRLRIAEPECQQR
jgi:hypothetical protein